MKFEPGHQEVLRRLIGDGKPTNRPAGTHLEKESGPNVLGQEKIQSNKILGRLLCSAYRGQAEAAKVHEEKSSIGRVARY